MNRKTSKDRNYYGELPTGYYDAVFKNGKFIDSSSNKEITLVDGAKVRIQVLLKDVDSDEDFEQHLNHKSQELEVGRQGHFRIDSHRFIVELLEPLILQKKGRRHSKLGRCKCAVVEYSNMEGHQVLDKPFERDSLNQLYSAISAKFFPEKTTHVGNVYEIFSFKGKKLKEYRIF